MWYKTVLFSLVGIRGDNFNEDLATKEDSKAA
jgi:hypothetical protein